MKLKGKKILITGASSGLGFSLAKLLVSKGCKVYGIGRSESGVKQAKKALNKKSFICEVCDVTDAKQVEQLVGKVGVVDVLINNAGVWLEGLLQDNPAEDISRTIDVNLKGVIYMTKQMLPLMVRRNNGIIVNVSSTSGTSPKISQSVYVASKWGVTGFTKSLQMDLKDTNIKVVGFYPGGMRTKMFAKAGNPKENQDWMDTDTVAEIVVSILEQDDSMVSDHVVLNKRLTKTSN